MQTESKPKTAETYSNLSADFGGMPGTLLPGTDFKGLHTESMRLYLHDKINGISKV